MPWSPHLSKGVMLCSFYLIYPANYLNTYSEKIKDNVCIIPLLNVNELAYLIQGSTNHVLANRHI